MTDIQTRARLIGILMAAVTAATVLAQAGGDQPQGTPPTPPADEPRVARLKSEAVADIDSMKVFSQQMVDSVFSFGELGFQETETSKYLVDVLRKNGFNVEQGVAGIPTAFMATWGNGKPVIALGSDVDGIPQASQKPGVAYRDPIVEGAPGHGEGHNSGLAVNITAAIVLKRIMERVHPHTSDPARSDWHQVMVDTLATDDPRWTLREARASAQLCS